MEQEAQGCHNVALTVADSKYLKPLLGMDHRDRAYIRQC